MSVSLEKVPVSSLLPNSLIQRVQLEGEEKKLEEAQMCAIALLIINTVLGAVRVLKRGHYKALDANPGDGGCQTRALELYRLAMLDLEPECSALEKTASEIKALVNKRKGSPKERVKCPPLLFFQNHVGALRVSKEMEYILQCYLSAVLRTPYQVLENGVIMTKSEISTLSERITLLDALFRRKIVEENQKTLSLLSVEAVRFSAAQITSLASREKELIVRMLSAEQTHIFTPDIKYEPKAFGCLFYEIKTLLIRLREEQGISCLKSIVATGSPFHLFLRSPMPGEEFEVLADEACTSLLPITSIVVFEAVVHVEKERAAGLLREQGFTTTILMQAAQADPYEPKSKLADVKVPEAVQEINACKEQGVNMRDFLTLDHIYFNRLGEELQKEQVR
jgi:hypothetical protein